MSAFMQELITLHNACHVTDSTHTGNLEAHDFEDVSVLTGGISANTIDSVNSRADLM